MKSLFLCFFAFIALSRIASAQTNDLFLRLPLLPESPAFQKSWISQIRTQDSTGYEIFEAKITPLTPDSSLALTFYFEEKEFKTLRILWIPQIGDPQTLSPNLTEGTAHQNQRTVLLSSTLLSPHGGSLFIQSDQLTLDLQAIHFQWTQAASLLSSAPLSLEPHLLTPSGFLRFDEVSGQPSPAPTDMIQESLSITTLVTQPEAIETTAYGIELTQTPCRARLELEVQGLPVDEPLRLSLNGVDLGPLPIETPSLKQRGYLFYQSTYWGWRKASLWIPTTALQVGVNSLQLVTVNGRSVSIKNMIFEADYHPPTNP